MLKTIRMPANFKINNNKYFEKKRKSSAKMATSCKLLLIYIY